MTTTLRTLPLSELSIHPKNPRQKVVADDELVASIKEHGLVQPLVVAPAAAPADGYVILAGHRRHAAAKKARLKELPCIVREDLDTDKAQVMAMYLENSSREDLSPIEKAKTYQALIDFGWKQKDIARVTGCAPKTVSARLKLLKLRPTTQRKVHAGQVTIEESIALVDFADDPEATAKLEKAAGTYNFQYELQHARKARKVLAEIATESATLEQDGIASIEVDMTGHGSWWGWLRDKGYTEIQRSEIAEHGDHVRQAIRPTSYQGDVPALVLLCLDPAKHASADDVEEERKRAERKALNDARLAAESIARGVRLDLITENYQAVFAGNPVLVTFVRSVLPALTYHLAASMTGHDTYAERVDLQLPEGHTGLHYAPGALAWLGHISDLNEASDARVVDVFVETLAIWADDAFTTTGYHVGGDDLHRAVNTSYADHLEALGHEWQDVEQEALTQARPAVDETEAVSA